MLLYPFSAPSSRRPRPILRRRAPPRWHPPVLQFLRFDPPEIQDGGTAILSVGATDDLSGVKSITGTVRSPSEAAAIPFVAQDAGGNGVFTASISIAHQAETGNWYVGMIQIVDGADNPLSVAFAKATVPPGGALRVVSADSDSTPPTVHQVTLDKGTVSGGEKNQIVVEVDDDRSGVAFVTGTFQGPSKSAFISFTCGPKGEGTRVGDVPVPANADCGEWTVYVLRVSDKAHNTAVLMADAPEVSRVSFGVVGGSGCDSDAPVIDTLYVTPGVISNQMPSEVVLTVAAHDEGSGLASLSGRVEGPVPPSGEVPRSFFSAKPDPQNPDAPILIKIAVPQLAAKGIWRVSAIRLTDKAGNVRAYEGADPMLANAFFTVE